MLSLVVTKHVKRKTAKEKLRLCRKERIEKEIFESNFGDITLYTVYHYTKEPFFTPERIGKALKEELFSPSSDIPKEYLVSVVLDELIEKLKRTSGKTVCLNREFCYSPRIDEICRYAKKVYTLFPIPEERINKIYETYGTLPVFSKLPVAADFCPDIKTPFNPTLPKELEKIRPKEFSPLLFASLLYKKNGRLFK